MYRGRFKVGSKHHHRSLKKCRSSPASHTCRKHVYYSKGMKANGKEPRARSLKRHMLTKNKSGKIVSKRKSAQASKQYHINNSKLKQWNEAAKRTLYVSDNYSIEFPMLDEDFDDDSPYVPFDPTSPQRPPRKSKRPKTPNKRPDFIYYGSRP
jgi:hypothetical protein